MADLKTLCIDAECMNIPDITSLIDSIYPIGSFYYTTDVDFDPNTTFGGTWELLDEGVVIVTAGENHPVSNESVDGGSETVTMTESQMPSHTHKQNSHNHDSGATTGGYMVSSGDIVVNPTKRAYAAQNTSGVHYILAASALQIGEYRYTGTTTAVNQNTGGGQAIDNMPPYKNAYCWHRTA